MTSSTMTSLELEEVRQDRDTARDEVNMLRLELNNLKSDFQVFLRVNHIPNSHLVQAL